MQKETNDEGKPGLLWAVLFKYTEIEKMLREAGAELDEQALKLYLETVRAEQRTLSLFHLHRRQDALGPVEFLPDSEHNPEEEL